MAWKNKKGGYLKRRRPGNPKVKWPAFADGDEAPPPEGKGVSKRNTTYVSDGNIFVSDNKYFVSDSKFFVSDGNYFVSDNN
jgi:hypothetical protein